jgi:hypothetical protein
VGIGDKRTLCDHCKSDAPDPKRKYRQFFDLRYLKRNTIDIGNWYTKLDLSGGLINLPEKNGQNLFTTKATRRTTGGLQGFHIVTTQ